MNKVIIITGQTASGKSAYALDLAEKINGEIINSDAFQIYKETPILSSIPKSEKILHHLYCIIFGNESFSIKTWLDAVLDCVKKIHQNNKIPIIVGGSPMYNRCLINGINDIPDIPLEIETKINNMEINDVYNSLIQKDKLSFNIEKNNKHRILRAYKVFCTTGRSIYSFHKEQKKPLLNGYIVEKILITIRKDKLHLNCIKRFDQMIKNGAIYEVEKLYQNCYDENSMIFNTIGVKEIKSYLDNKITINKAIDLSITRTKQYAKKQATWFRNKFQDFKIINCDN